MGGNKAFKCLNCVQSPQQQQSQFPPDFSAHIDDDNELEEEETTASKYDGYGDFMYYFDEHEFDFDNDKHWDVTNGQLSKCSIAIPGLGHKLCVDADIDNNHQIRFSAASNEEIDNTYYNLYGYDEYYYNTNNDELAELYDDNYEQYGDYDYYEDLDLHERQRRQLSSEEDLNEYGVPFGYDQDEYGDIDNGYDEDHPREGIEDETAAKRREEIESMEEAKKKKEEEEEEEYQRLKEEKMQPQNPFAAMYGQNPYANPYFRRPGMGPGALPRPSLLKRSKKSAIPHNRRLMEDVITKEVNGMFDDDEMEEMMAQQDYDDFIEDYFDWDTYHGLAKDGKVHKDAVDMMHNDFDGLQQEMENMDDYRHFMNGFLMAQAQDTEKSIPAELLRDEAEIDDLEHQKYNAMMNEDNNYDDYEEDYFYDEDLQEMMDNYYYEQEYAESQGILYFFTSTLIVFL